MNSPNRTNSKERAKVDAREGRYLSVSPCSACSSRWIHSCSYWIRRYLPYCMVMESVTLLDFVVEYSVPNKAKLTRTRLFLLFKDVLLRAKLPVASSYLEMVTELTSSPFTSWSWMARGVLQLIHQMDEWRTRPCSSS